MGGRMLAERLALTRPGIKVLYMSGYADDAIVHHGTLDPGTHFIAKPFTATDLARKVRDVLNGENGNPAGDHERPLEVDAGTEDQRLGDALQALPGTRWIGCGKPWSPHATTKSWPSSKPFAPWIRSWQVGCAKKPNSSTTTACAAYSVSSQRD
jgi:hypothetical protein